MVTVQDYWPEVSSDLTRVTWSHATNSMSLLDTALTDNTMMIEADVSMGHDKEPIMAHPPHNTSDLTLEKFLETIMDTIEDKSVKKGIKLDFKDLEILHPSLEILDSFKDRIHFPLMLNADILLGPGGSTPINAEKFLWMCSQYFPDVTLSVGWTTAAQGEYSSSTLLPMIPLLVKHSISSPVTLPMRASLITHSIPAIMDFLIQIETAGIFPTITVWTSEQDKVDREKLDQFLDTIGRDRVYLDIPWHNGSPSRSRIHLQSLLVCLLSLFLF